jgi:hypothetical protein
MQKTEYKLEESFEAVGEWWLPERPTEKVHGTLRYSRTSITLELSGTFEAVKEEDLMYVGGSFTSYDCIHGRSNDGVRFTLFRTLVIQQGATTKLMVIYVIVGSHTAPLESLRLTAISMYVTHLDTFAARQLFDSRREHDQENLKSISIKYVQPEGISWPVPEFALTFKLEWAVRYRSGPMSEELNACCFIKIIPEYPEELECLTSNVWRVCDLLTMLTDEVVTPTALEIDIKDEKRLCWLLNASIGESLAEAERSSPVLLFHLAHFVDDFQMILLKWFSANEVMLDAIALTMDARRNRERSWHVRFLLLAQAVEVFSRATTASTYMPGADYEKVAAALSSAIPEGVSTAHRASLKSKIKYGNELAFYKRVLQLVKSLSKPAQEIVCKNPAEFARGIADTRNYYTHFTDELRPKALTGEAGIRAGEKLLLLLRILLLKHVGLNEELIVERMSEHHRLLQTIALWKSQPESISD